ncbi:thioesterase II family protein [Actinomadura sp. GTD37]|uniref:thioesterase II family protein n=1 Tax=Actinomadura sp. GTD37 TaxID=1778030 RepID=UPI0035C05576
MSARDRWFHRPVPRPDARVRLVCVPYAGAGAAAFNGWPALLADDVELVGVRLPGRENRLAERPLSDWPSLVAEFTGMLMERVRSPYVLFGHSMGAMLAYEAAVSGLDRRPDRVVVSACRPPGAPRMSAAIHDLPGPGFAEGLARLGGMPPQILASRDLMAMLEPVLRADIRLAETWREDAAGREPEPVPVPVTALWGSDDEVAPRDTVAAWKALAPGGFTGHQVPGGHFFLDGSAAAVIELLDRELRP